MLQEKKTASEGAAQLERRMLSCISSPLKIHQLSTSQGFKPLLPDKDHACFAQHE
jgi:hypothetical protein